MNPTTTHFVDFGHNPFVVVDPTSTSDSNAKSSTPSTTTTTTTIFGLPHNNNNIQNNNNNNAGGANFYWDFTADEPSPFSSQDLTPELSPSLTEFSPALNSSSSPYGFDGLDLDDLNRSPSAGWESPFEDSAGADLFPGESFDFDFAFHTDLSPMADFQLFPDESASLKKLLMAPTPDETNSILDIKNSPIEPILDHTIKLSPFEPQLEYSACTSVSPADLGNYPDIFSTAKILGHDVLPPNTRVAPRKPVQSPTKPGFQPNKRRRRRRITSEESSRVVAEDDPDARARYQCDQCLKTFSRPFNLRSHRAIHLGVKPYPCTHVNERGATCHWAFARRHDLDRHIKSRHERCNTFTCKTCGTECARTDALKKHLARCAPAKDDSAAAWVEQDIEQVSHL
ncbi:hypothetical protein BGZ98_007495 [Dissophora globulifera]|nr:hypothetical protein BGZ98_007495 [Dissophora globulifera]